MLKIDESTEYRVQREMRAERNAKFSIINSQLKKLTANSRKKEGRCVQTENNRKMCKHIKIRIITFSDHSLCPEIGQELCRTERGVRKTKEPTADSRFNAIIGQFAPRGLQSMKFLHIFVEKLSTNEKFSQNHFANYSNSMLRISLCATICAKGVCRG